MGGSSFAPAVFRRYFLQPTPVLPLCQGPKKRPRGLPGELPAASCPGLAFGLRDPVPLWVLRSRHRANCRGASAALPASLEQQRRLPDTSFWLDRRTDPEPPEKR